MFKSRITFIKMKHILYQRLIFSANTQIYSLFLLLVILLTVSCTSKVEQEKPKPISDIKVVPAPTKLLYKRGYFQLEKSTRLLMNLSDAKSKKIGEHFLQKLKEKTKYKIKIADQFTTSKVKSSIEIITEHTNLLTSESFKIEVKTGKIKIYAKGERGLFYAINTVISLINKTNKAAWQAPQLIIEDTPNSTFRGLVLNLDSLPISQQQLTELVLKNRINTVITNSDWIYKSEYITINKINKHNRIDEAAPQTIKEFYNSKTKSLDSTVYIITNKNQLHPDSLTILGEAMWSSPSKRNYTLLLNHLNGELTK